MNISFIKHRYNIVKTVKSRTVWTGQKDEELKTIDFFVCRNIDYGAHYYKKK